MVATLNYAVNAPASGNPTCHHNIIAQCQATGQISDIKSNEFVGSSKLQYDHDRDVARSAGFVLVTIRLCAQSKNTEADTQHRKATSDKSVQIRQELAPRCQNMIVGLPRLPIKLSSIFILKS